MTILDSLAKDHRALESLLAELADTTSQQSDKRLDLFSRLQALLVAHSRAEEEVVYRRLVRAAPDEEDPLEAFEEHHVADLLLQELASSKPAAPGWVAKVKVLEELLRHHIKEEEMNIFPLVEDKLGADLTRMDREFQMLKHEPLERALGPIRRATPAFAGRAAIGAQAAIGRYLRRGERYLRQTVERLRSSGQS